MNKYSLGAILSALYIQMDPVNHLPALFWRFWACVKMKEFLKNDQKQTRPKENTFWRVSDFRKKDIDIE